MAVHDIANMHYDCFNTRSFVTHAHKFVDPNVVMVDGPSGTEYHGLSGYVYYICLWLEAFPNATIQIVEQRVTGNIVITDIVGNGVFTGQFRISKNVVPGNRHYIELPLHDQVEVKNGKIIRCFTDYDACALMNQLKREPPSS